MVLKTVSTLGATGGGTPGGSNTQVQYNSSGAFAGSANLTFDGTTLTAAGLAGPHNGTVGATTPTTGVFTTAKAIAAATQDSVTLQGRAGGTGSFGVTLTPTTLTASRTLTLPDASGTILQSGTTVTTAQGGTGLTSFTANGVVYASSSSALATGSALTFDGTNFLTTGSATGAAFIPSGSTVPTNGMYLPATNTVAWSTNTTERARINSSGNLGLGVTPSAWGSSSSVLEVGKPSVTSVTSALSSGAALDLAYNCYFDGTNWVYKGSYFATRYSSDVGQHKWYNAPSGTAGNAITFTQALTLNANGALVLQGGNTSASGVGVAFPATQSASTDANTLDDYEEGTWTPTDGSGAGLTFAAGTTGIYTKIGRVVYISASVRYPVTASASSAQINGLPFTMAASPDGAQGGMTTNYSAATAVLVFKPNNGTTDIIVRAQAGGAQQTNASMSNTRYDFSGFYIV